MTKIYRRLNKKKKGCGRMNFFGSHLSNFIVFIDIYMHMCVYIHVE